MTKRSKYDRRLDQKPRVASLAMLCLVGHALFVSVTHHHKPSLPFAPSSAVVTDKSNDAGGGSELSSDGDCTLCRLQRNFTSNIQTASILVQQFDQTLNRSTPASDKQSSGCSLLLFSRGPPLA